jgi:hypothetical protein
MNQWWSFHENEIGKSMMAFLSTHHVFSTPVQPCNSQPSTSTLPVVFFFLFVSSPFSC